ncbi:hypothetical protein K461DRAFT_316379 [Myriangium duriaei CBS 260.36]|uniref:Uncharacterized protein n=1 Tax=Myriangium duriaei CBS 260.36 TaxID=1168546 RepID=A0A9P4IXM1_9PEZI|nr:hypothetical protein K461DRAFT_316379 [Myriangium duriaei CBS 260.36]
MPTRLSLIEQRSQLRLRGCKATRLRDSLKLYDQDRIQKAICDLSRQFCRPIHFGLQGYLNGTLSKASKLLYVEAWNRGVPSPCKSNFRIDSCHLINHVLQTTTKQEICQNRDVRFSHILLPHMHEVWHFVLPLRKRPTLALYKKGCWQFTERSKRDEGSDHQEGRSDLCFDFHHKQLDHVRYEAPLMFVNHEACSVARARFGPQPIRPCNVEGRSYPCFKHCFDPDNDALYIDPDQWEDFLDEPDSLLWEPSVTERFIDHGPGLLKVAIPEVLLAQENIQDTRLPELFTVFGNLQVLFIVLGSLPDLRTKTNPSSVTNCWDIEDDTTEILTWDQEKREFDYSGHQGGPLSKLKVVTKERIGAEAHRSCEQTFEIRTVSIIRRLF